MYNEEGDETATLTIHVTVTNTDHVQNDARRHTSRYFAFHASGGLSLCSKGVTDPRHIRNLQSGTFTQ